MIKSEKDREQTKPDTVKSMNLYHNPGLTFRMAIPFLNLTKILYA